MKITIDELAVLRGAVLLVLGRAIGGWIQRRPLLRWWLRIGINEQAIHRLGHYPLPLIFSSPLPRSTRVTVMSNPFGPDWIDERHPIVEWPDWTITRRKEES